MFSNMVSISFYLTFCEVFSGGFPMVYYVDLFQCDIYLLYIFILLYQWCPRRFFIAVVCVNIICFLHFGSCTFGVLTFPLFFLSLPFSFKINWHVFITELHQKQG